MSRPSQSVQRGLSLLELTLVLGGIAGLLGVLMVAWKDLSGSTQGAEVGQAVAQLSESIRDRYQTLDTYAGLNNGLAREIAPEALVRGTSLQTRWGPIATSPIAAVPGAANSGFLIRLTGWPIPTKACASFMAQVVPGTYRITRGSTTYRNANLMLPGQSIASLCAAPVQREVISLVFI